MWLLLQMPCPLIGPFSFRVLVCHYQLVDSGLVLCTMCIALLEPQAIAMMLHRIVFHLSHQVVALYLDNSTAKAILCNQGGTVSPFLSRLVCRILHLTDKHSITLIPAYILTHLNVEANYLSWGQLLLEWHLLPQIAQVAFHLWGLPEVALLASSHTTQCQHYCTLETPLALWGLGVECLQPSLEVSGKLFVSSSCIGSSSCWHRVVWRLLGFPEYSTSWQTFLCAVPSQKISSWMFW